MLARDSATNTAKLAPGFALRAEFRDRYADWGRDLVLYLGQRRCGRKLKESGALAGGIDYGSVSGAIRRLEKSDQHQKLMRKLLQQALRQIEND